ncbi:SusD/RagB family nutrient-binding outer membrane lipoprotein [Reichenbachiella sp.]|uniref:SusD/RagB family nutrient-binding outer membrane lipoprotein n=1 Tax=Reichenbachiella sp. TaxID=2184521 RepID=UPI0032976D62
MKKIYMLVLICSITLCLGACTSEFDEINTNNNVPTENNPATLLPSVIFEPINAHMTLQTWLTDQIMHYYVRRNDNQLDAYDFATGEAFFNEIWQKNYAAIWNANDMMAGADAEGLSAYVAAGKIMKSYYLATNAELWINAPASAAGLGGENIAPSYDSQQVIYASVLQELEEANTLLDANAEFVNGGDVLFNGDVSRWKKLANSLRLRYLLRLSNKSEINAAAEIDQMVSDPGTYPIITSNADAGFYQFSGISPDVSSFALQAITTFSGMSMSKRMQDVYEVYDDPRMDYFFRLPENATGYPNHEGVQNGLTREAAQSWNGNGDANTSLLTTRFVEDPDLLNYTIISHAEVQFILAEAALNDWISTGTATQYSNAGITANFDQWGITMPAGFLALPEVAFDATMERLMDQKWLSYLFNNTVESWGEHKRTGLPNLTLGPLASTVTSGEFATRVFYPTLEQSINSANYESAVNSIGADNIVAKHWYQN